MRVLMITPLYPPAVGGAATYFGQIAEKLSTQAEIEKIVILTERPKGEAARVDQGKDLTILRSLVPRVGLPEPGKVFYITSYVHTQLWFSLRLASLVRRLRIQLIHFHTRCRGKLFYHALRSCPVPVIADLRDKMTAPETLLAVTDHLLCCSEGVRDYAQQGRFPSEHTTVVPVPFSRPKMPEEDKVRQTRKKLGLSDSPYLLYVGDINLAKGVYKLLQVYRQWRITHPDCRLVLAGPNREGRKFTSEVSETAGAVHLGSLNHTDVLALMRGAEILVLLSCSEGLPRVILEALSMDTKVICPPGVPEFDEHLPDSVLATISSNALLDKIRQVWTSPPHFSYPFSTHDVDLGIRKLVGVYENLL